MYAANTSHCNGVLHKLNLLREREELTDVVLEVEGRSFPCHRAVLAAFTLYFRGMFTSGYAEAKQETINIQDVSGVAMATILDYLYTGVLHAEPDQVQAVMSAARLLQVDFVARQAAEYMKDHLDVSNCADVLMYADMQGDSDLVKASNRYMASRFNQVALQPSFLQLSLPLLQSLLDRDDLMTSSEDDVVQAALRWIKSDQEERMQHLPALSKSFRHSFISPKQLAEIETKCLPTDSKVTYSKSTDQRLGHVRTEMQIFLQEDFLGHDSQQCAPCFDPSTGELYRINMPKNLDSFSVTATVDHELYLAGGILAKKDNILPGMTFRQRKFYQFNHLLNTWEPRCEMISPRVRCGLVYLKGFIYAIGGDSAKESAERYDPSCDEWTPIPAIPQSMSSELCVVTLDDSIYVISKEGCYCFSTTENKWRKIADMIQPPLHPQAITYQGCIYCIDCDKDWGDPVQALQTCIEMYNPANGEWKQSGNGKSYVFDTATLVKHGGTLYIFTVQIIDDHRNIVLRKKSVVYVNQYHKETESWLNVTDKDSLVFPSNLMKWLGSGNTGNRTDCLVARLIPQCLGKRTLVEDLVAEMFPDEEEENNDSSDSSGSGISDDSDSEDNLLYQEDSDEDNSHEDGQSGSDEEDV
ncbi:kelch repeat and BTB domain-containing protein 8-like [Branchiostoma floridae x Branchiostoma japonicum]